MKKYREIAQESGLYSGVVFGAGCPVLPKLQLRL